MKVHIKSIKDYSDEAVEITALVYWRSLPRPDYENNETDEKYTTRVGSIAKDINGYNNLHIGWAELKQESIDLKMPKVDEYDT